MPPRTAPFSLVLVLLASPLTANASFVTKAFEWTGDTGYSVLGSVTYDASLPDAIADSSFISGIEDLSFEFRDPAGQQLQQVDNVVDFTSSYSFLLFNLDTATLELRPGFDVGRDGGLSSDFYLFDLDDGSFVLNNGLDAPVDRSARAPVLVPEPATALLLVGGTLGLARPRRRHPLR